MLTSSADFMRTDSLKLTSSLHLSQLLGDEGLDGLVDAGKSTSAVEKELASTNARQWALKAIIN
jgi:hypothetical protein